MTIVAKMQRDFLIFLRDLSLTFVFLKDLSVYFILVALGLHCCVWAFSGCSEWGLLFLVVCGLLIAMASFIVEHRLKEIKLTKITQLPGLRILCSCLTLRSYFVLSYCLCLLVTLSLQNIFWTLISFTAYTDTIPPLGVRRNWTLNWWPKRPADAKCLEQVEALTGSSTLIPVTYGTKSLVISLEVIGLNQA